MSNMQAARIVRVKEPLEVQTLETPKPRGSQVLVKVQSAGVCHSDIHLWDGGYEGPAGQFMKATDRGVKYPLTPGHEVAGVVENMGEEVEGFAKNEKVLVFPWIGEGLCPACRIGEENLCDKPRSLGVYNDGGYAEYVLVPSYKYLAKIHEMDPDVSAPLSCSALTAYGAVKNAQLKPNDNAVIVAGGALQLNLVAMPNRAYKLIGSYTGSMTDMLELVSLTRRGVIKPVISNRFKLNQATEALTMLKEGKIIGRGIINP